jgi:hypothetical protein
MYYSDYIVIPEKKLIIEHFSGEINLGIILKQKYRESIDTKYNRNYNVINDSRNAVFFLNSDDIKNYVDHIRNNEFLNRERNVAFLTKTPNQVVIATLFKELKKELPINVSIVSTLNAALRGVELLSDENKLVKFNLNKLKNQSCKYNIKQINNDEKIYINSICTSN